MTLLHGWSLVSLDKIAVPEKGAIRRGPFGGSIKKEIFVADGYKVYEQQNPISTLGVILLTNKSIKRWRDLV